MEYVNIGLHHMHNALRWAILISGFIAVYRAYSGFSGKKNWTNADQKAGLWFLLFCHLQLLVGLMLYFYMGYQNQLANMGETMKNHVLRYWSVEHLFGMLIAIALVQIGRIKTKKANPDHAKHKKALIWFGLGLILILINIPWPWGAIPRPIFPGM
ncbi:MAG: hypothetical protein H6605_02070 [Flavobacteriales bacterium]|nr:hypothetical protein [Flavobacteriales bacterium]